MTGSEIRSLKRISRRFNKLQIFCFFRFLRSASQRLERYVWAIYHRTRSCFASMSGLIFRGLLSQEMYKIPRHSFLVCRIRKILRITCEKSRRYILRSYLVNMQVYFDPYLLRIRFVVPQTLPFRACESTLAPNRRQYHLSHVCVLFGRGPIVCRPYDAPLLHSSTFLALLLSPPVTCSERALP